ncbi:IclR family transcriptional regulator [Blastococcus sp. SYSU D00820]
MTTTFPQPPPRPAAAPRPRPSEAERPTTAIDRVATLLDAFEGPGRLTLAQITRRTGLPRSSAHRMLEQLVAHRWLRRTDRTYELGTRLLELGSLAVHQDRLHQAALPVLHELQDVTGLVVHLAVLDGPDVIYLEKIGGRFATRLPSRVGGRQPAHCTSVGKVLLGFGPHGTVRRVLDGQLPQRTTRSITSVAVLERELAKVREYGVAYDKEEALPGVGCVAAPIVSGGHAVAAVSVSGPIEDLKLGPLSSPVRMAALGIMRNSRCSPMPLRRAAR